MVEILVGNKKLQLLVDSGARITMITQKLFTETWSERSLSPPDRSPISYEGRKIELLGFIEDFLVFKGRRIRGKIYVAVKGLNILGWFHQGLFGMVLKPGTKEQVMLVACEDEGAKWKSKYPSVFGNTLGKITGFRHKIIVRWCYPYQAQAKRGSFQCKRRSQ